jgi:hypothetical protein
MQVKNLFGTLIASFLIVGTIKTSSSWRDSFNIAGLKNYLTALYAGNQAQQPQEQTKKETLTTLESTHYDACIDFVSEFITNNMSSFTVDEQLTLLKFKKLMLQRLYQNQEKAQATLHDIEKNIEKISELKQK